MVLNNTASFLFWVKALFTKIPEYRVPTFYYIRCKASPIRFRAALLCYPALDPADRSGATAKSPFACSFLRLQRGMSLSSMQRG